VKFETDWAADLRARREAVRLDLNDEEVERGGEGRRGGDLMGEVMGS